MKRESLVKQFKKVGLVLKITDEPIGRTTNDDIFQMDVGRNVVGTRRTEWFEIWPGHDDNKIQILDIDNKLNQEKVGNKAENKRLIIEDLNLKMYEVLNLKKQKLSLLLLKKLLLMLDIFLWVLMNDNSLLLNLLLEQLTLMKQENS